MVISLGALLSFAEILQMKEKLHVLSWERNYWLGLVHFSNSCFQHCVIVDINKQEQNPGLHSSQKYNNVNILHLVHYLNV